MSHSDPSSDIIREAMNLQIAGHLNQALALYRDVLDSEPHHCAANHCLGMLMVQLRRPDDGLSALRVAVENEPSNPNYWLGYLEALLLTGQIEDAEATLDLGRQHGLSGAAVEEFATRLRSQVTPGTPVPAAPGASALIAPGESVPPATGASLPSAPGGSLLTAPGAPARVDRADVRRMHRRIGERERALETMLKRRQFGDALDCARSLTEDFPERLLGWKTLGALLFANGGTDEPVAAMQRALNIAPRDAETHRNLGTIFNKLGRLAEAETSLRRALDIDPALGPAHAHLGTALELQGRFAEAEASFRSAILHQRAMKTPDTDLHHTSLLFLMSHNPDIAAGELFAMHCQAGKRLESMHRRVHAASDPGAANADLRVGFVSGDFYNHAVASYLEPVLNGLQQYADLVLYGYYNNVVEDEFTLRFRGLFRHWRGVFEMSDTQLARQISNDRIDILIDLSGYTSFNRLRVFAKKPSPLQASWIGYPGTTGLRTMDYYLTDRHLTPPGKFDHLFTEKLVYLPRIAPFRPFDHAPPVNALPALTSGMVTFGSFNRLGKLNDYSLRLWSELMVAVPRSRLLLANVASGEQQSRLVTAFATRGVASDRLLFRPRMGMAEYLALHQQVDLCLDTFPYNGSTTSMHAAWMGVPTLTIAGTTVPGYAGACVLALVGAPEFIADDAVDFVVKGRHWCAHLTQLAEVRAVLRTRLLQSASLDPAAIPAGFARALRHMWTLWCAGEGPQTFTA